jgi:hypothetical protein
VKALLTSTALVAALALPALAQDAPTSPFQTEAMGPSVTASDMIGSRIYVSEAAVDADAYAGVQEGWDDIGEVNDIVLGRDGSVDAVLVDIGGFLGIGERQVAVDMAALRIVQDDATDADDWFLVLQTDRATLDAAPEWVIPGADIQTDGATDAGADVAPMDDAAGDQAATTPDAEAAPGTMEDPAAAETLTEDPLTDQAATDGAATDGMATDSTATDGTAMDSTATDGTAIDGMATDGTETDGTAADMTATDPAATDPNATERTMALPEGYAEVNREELTAETLTGANVHDSTDASIAEVSDLVLTGDGQVTDVILDVGGFLGIGARTVAIPMDRLTVARTDAGDVTLWVDMTKEELEALPEYSM